MEYNRTESLKKGRGGAWRMKTEIVFLASNEGKKNSFLLLARSPGAPSPLWRAANYCVCTIYYTVVVDVAPSGKTASKSSFVFRHSLSLLYFFSFSFLSLSPFSFYYYYFLPHPLVYIYSLSMCVCVFFAHRHSYHSRASLRWKPRARGTAAAAAGHTLVFSGVARSHVKFFSSSSTFFIYDTSK